MILLGGILLAIFVLPEGWRLPVILLAAVVEVAETLFWLWYSAPEACPDGAGDDGRRSDRSSRPAPRWPGAGWGGALARELRRGSGHRGRVRVIALDGLTLLVERAADSPMIVREALVADPRVLQADAPAREVAAVLARPQVVHVLVTDGDRLVGSVGEDSIVAAVAEDRDLRQLTARDLADPDVPIVDPDTPSTRRSFS